MANPLTLPSEAVWRKAVPLLVLAGLCAYCNSFNKAFVYDDPYWITGDKAVKNWGGLFTAMNSRLLIAVSLILNDRLGGDNPPLYHAFNLAAHILAGLALFGIVRRTLLLERWQGRFERSAAWLAFAVALVWLVHPLQTEAVTYVIQRCESFMGLFYLFCLYCVVRGAASPHPRWWYAGAVGSAVGSALCKEVAATLPLVVLLYDWVFLAGGMGEIVKRRWGLYAGLLLVWVWLGGWMSPLMRNPEAGLAVGPPPFQYLLTESEVLWHYLRLSFWPSPQCLDYLGWPVAHKIGDVLLPGLGIVALLLLTAWGLIRRSWLGFLGAWFFLILAPTSTVITLPHVCFEHRMYLSLAAVIVLVVMAGHTALNWLEDRLHAPARLGRTLGVAAVVGSALVLCVLTIRRNEDYRSPITIWQSAVAVRPDNPFAQKTLGNSCYTAGLYDEALPHLEASHRLAPDSSETYIRGQVHFAKGAVDQAIDLFTQAIQANRRWIYFNDRGVAHYFKGETAEAVADFREAVQLSPPHVALPRYNLAAALAEVGQRDEARAMYAEALRLDPAFPARGNRTARQLALAHDPNRPLGAQEALFLAKKACQATGERGPEMLDTLAMAYAAVGDFDHAIATTRKALQVARAADDKSWPPVLEERLQHYERHQPLGESAGQ